MGSAPQGEWIDAAPDLSSRSGVLGRKMTRVGLEPTTYGLKDGSNRGPGLGRSHTVPGIVWVLPMRSVDPYRKNRCAN